MYLKQMTHQRLSPLLPQNLLLRLFLRLPNGSNRVNDPIRKVAIAVVAAEAGKMAGAALHPHGTNSRTLTPIH